MSRFCFRLMRLASRPSIFLVLCVLAILTRGPQAHAIIDQNGNGMDDVWELRYHAQGLDPNSNADNDGIADLYWQNTKTGDFNVWIMNLGNYASGVQVSNVPTDWIIVGAGDFDGDGQTDILWQNTKTGDVNIWLMKNGVYSNGYNIAKVPVEWRVVGVADFNGDGQPDILWENDVTGDCAIWLMNHTSYASGVIFSTVPTEWKIVGTGDFNGDKMPDIVWQNIKTGDRALWLMNGTAWAANVVLPNIPTDWNIAAVGDVNGDGQPDLIWQNKVTGDRTVWIMDGVNYSRGIDLGVISLDWQIRTAADFNNDGLTNLQESRAGTDPFDPRSTLRITQVEYGSGTATIHWSSVAGKQYQLYASTDPNQPGGGWTPLGGPQVGTGKPMAATFSVTPAQRYFRIDVADLDSDGDGVSDWEELQLGLNPYSSCSDGVTPDYQRALAVLQAATSTLTVSATDSFGSAASGDAGIFTITRTGRLDALTINYSLGGTATPGTDYTAPAGTVTLPVGVNSATVRISPLASGMTSPRTVVLTLGAGASYSVGTPASATVSLAPRPASGQVLQEIWFGLSSGTVSLIPVNTPPASSRLLTTLENPTTAPLGNKYGTRIRGYLVPPTTGNYTFWIASDDQSELWISTDSQPANRVKRAYVSTFTNSRQWTKEANQQSSLIALTAGQKYYFDVLQANGTGGENLAVGWLKPGQTGTAPSEIVGATAGTLAPFIPAVVAPDPSTLYFSNLVPISGGPSGATGFAAVRLSPDGTFAVVTMSTSNLAGPITGLTINGPADPGQSAGVLFNLLATTPQSDGSYLWTITAANGQTPAGIVQAIQSGRTYVNVATSAYPSGALRGQLALRSATGNFTPPANPPALPGGLPTAADAARFLTQATFGPNPALLAQVQSSGFDAFLNAQINAPMTLSTLYTDAAIAALPAGTSTNTQFVNVWWKNTVTAPDQLRQRVAFALSEIMVISDNSNGLTNNPIALASYYDLLVRDAFGNFRQLLEDVTLHPTMGNYLDMVHNDKPSLATGTEPNQNYGREVMQLFTIGLNKLNPDGTLLLDGNGKPILTYDQSVVEGYSSVFTGWYYASANPSWNYTPANYRAPMVAFPDHHDTGAKVLLDNVVLPANQSQAQDLKDALDVLFNHPNVGPFISYRLIQRLVTSNPSPAYVYRVAKVFADNGQGVRGDLAAVVKAILLDYEARSTSKPTDPKFGKEREPIVRLSNLYRAFNASAASGNFVVNNQTSNFGESIFDSPSVFNFFAPQFVQPGTLAQNGLVAPEFQITTDTTTISSANKMRSAVFQTASQSNLDAIVLDLSGLQAQASNPGALVDSLNALLMMGEMSQATRDRVVSAVTQISAGNTLERAQTAVHLLVTSPEFVIQK